jgi:excinuclease UvrABC nuclease subunit
MNEEFPETQKIAVRKIVGCYILWHENTPVYVGQSVNIVARIGVHSGAGKIFFDSYSYCELNQPTKEQLNNLESSLIIKYSPKYNKLMPENINYVSLLIVKDRQKIKLPSIKRILKQKEIYPVFRGYYKKEDLKAAGILP